MTKLIKLIKEARFVFLAGNGGSASTAEHFTNDLFKRGVRAICLSSNSSILTMLGNDYGYDRVFYKQVVRYMTPEDLFITISCSGTSKNIVLALEEAKRMGVKTYEFEKFKKDHDFGKLENKHLKFAHKITKLI